LRCLDELVSRLSKTEIENEFIKLHGEQAWTSVNGFRWSKKREMVERDGCDPNPIIRNARMHAEHYWKTKIAKFPYQETFLFDLFGERRAELLQVSRSWLKAKMKLLLRRDQPAGWENFKASDPWLNSFCERFNITSRRRTNNKSIPIDERLPQIKLFHQTAKLFRQPPPLSDQKYGRFRPENTFHLDQVPLEFGRVGEYTLAVKGSSFVAVKGSKRDLSKRLATLQLTFTACAPQRIKQIIVFRGTPQPLVSNFSNNFRAKLQRLENERKKMPKSIGVMWQKCAWFDTSMCLSYAKFFKEQISDNYENLVGIDNLSAQCSPMFKTKMREECNSLLLYTPEGCTDVCAVTDFGLGKAVKSRMRKRYERHFEMHRDWWVNGEGTIGEIRILLAQWLAEAWAEFLKDGGESQISRAFQHCGMLNAYDGSDDRLVKVTGCENYSFAETEESSSESSSAESSSSESSSSESEDTESSSDTTDSSSETESTHEFVNQEAELSWNLYD